MDWKAFLYGIIIVSLLFLIMASFGVIHVGALQSSTSVAGNAVGAGGNIPEKCQVPAGQDLASWKEHLGHHTETKDCLKYFN